ncbi:jmjC domain-containing protein E-like [Oscarella lobularis]|uniref:jmjC domain-containing protein E-like n=1 Tax=Oscarella lobularis TaxID=121494 RepID=UPI003313FD71
MESCCAVGRCGPRRPGWPDRPDQVLTSVTLRLENNSRMYLSTTATRKLFAWSLNGILLSFAVYYAFYKLGSQTKDVIRLDASVAGFSYRKVAELRRPTLLTSTIADKWKASTWTAQNLHEHLGNVSAYRQLGDPVFITFHDNKPLEPFVKGKWSDFNRKVNVSVPSVFSGKGEKERKDTYLYFSQNIGQLKPQFLSDVQPIKDLVLNDYGVQINLWIGRQGITTYTHYDATYNFFVQIEGEKRFTLFPPSTEMYLYPCLHPHYGHSQIRNLTDIDKTKFPKSSSDVKGIDVVLRSGDMLVLPPFWYHRVETLKSSVSVNVWNDAPEYLLMDEIYRKPIPLELDWELSKRALMTRLYIHMLAQRLELVSDELVENLFLTRYYPLHGFNPKDADLAVSSLAREEMSDICSSVNWNEHAQKFSGAADRGLREIIPLFSKIADTSIRILLLGNYIEHLANTCIGTERVYSFLEQCQRTGLS